MSVLTRLSRCGVRALHLAMGLRFLGWEVKLPIRRGVLVEEKGSTYMGDKDGDSDEARALKPLQAAACTHRTAFGPRAGLKVHGRTFRAENSFLPKAYQNSTNNSPGGGKRRREAGRHCPSSNAAQYTPM